MQMLVKGVNVNYTFYDNSSNVNLVYLHGWGQNIEMMMPIAKPFIKKYNVLIIDFPGFGDSDEPKEVWSVFDYAEMVNEIVNNLNMKNPIVIGHSFGGKIALIYGYKYKTRKVVVLASPYKQVITKPTLKMKLLKQAKKIPGLGKLENFVKKHVGSTDYRNASEMMRKVLVAHVNTDITEDLRKIKCPVLGIWGTNDEAVDIEDGRELENIIPNYGLVEYPGCTHYAYLENLGQTISVLNNFIGSGE